MSGNITSEDVSAIRRWNSIPQALEWRTIHDCVADFAAKDPDRHAIEAWDGLLTRGQVEARSSVFADFLRREGLGEGDVASILIPKSVWVPVVTLAVLKTGAAFILLDHSLPQKRLETISQATAPRIFIASRGNAGLACNLLPSSSTSVILWDTDGVPYIVKTVTTPTRKPRHPHSVNPDAPAFLICTSGSTGIPKTIVLQHFAWCTGYTENMHHYGIADGTRVLQQSSFNFVVSIFEMLSTLMCGGIVCIPSDFERSNDFAGAIRRLRPEVAIMAPSSAKVLLPKEVPSIRTLILVGEPIPSSMIRLWTSEGKRTIMNGYGQSEAASFNGLAVLDDEQIIGRNIGGSKWIRFWIVDPEDSNTLMPVGALGELLLEGYSLAHGYLNNVEQAARAFIDRPTWAQQFRAGENGRRWYLTGDLVRYQPNGEVSLYGRKDAQVKIRGQRVDTVEVEHHVLEHFESLIRQVAVVKTTPDGEQEQLTAFVVLKDNSSLDLTKEDSRGNDGFPSRRAMMSPGYSKLIGKLRSQFLSRLEGLLPSYMMPGNIVVVRFLAVTATGKVDRRRLSEWFGEKAAVEQRSSLQHGENVSNGSDLHALPPKGPTSLLVDLFSEHLQIPPEQIQPECGWSAYGADSVKAVSMIRRLRESGFPISLEELMLDLPINQIADRFSRSRSVVTSKKHSPVFHENAPVQLTDFQSHCVDASLGPSQSLVYRYDMYSIGNYDPTRLERAFKTVLANTEALRLVFTSRRPQWPSERQLCLLDPDQPAMAQRIVQTHRIDESTGTSSGTPWPLWYDMFRVWICSDAKESEIAVRIIFHHAILDATSWTMFLQDLGLTYKSDDGATPERPGFVSYLSRHQDKLANSTESTLYWRKLLHGSHLTLLRRSFDGLTEPYGILNIYTFTEIFHLPRSAHPTPFTTSSLVKAAWSVVLGCLAGKRDIVFLYLMHGRDETVSEDGDTIGCCVTEVPMRIMVDDEMTARSLLSSVQEQVLRSMQHAHLGAGAINKLSDWPGRDLLYQHSSILQHESVEETLHVTLGDDAYLKAARPHYVTDLKGDFEIFTRDCGIGALELTISTHRDLYSAVEVSTISKATVDCMRLLSDGMAVKDVRQVVQRELGPLALR